MRRRGLYRWFSVRAWSPWLSCLRRGMVCEDAAPRITGYRGSDLRGACPRIAARPHLVRSRSNRLGGQAVELILQRAAFFPHQRRLAVEDDLAVVDEQDPVGDGLDFLED